MNKKKIILPIILGLALVLGIVIGVYFDFPNNTFAYNETAQREGKIRQIINFIDYEYVDDVNTDSLLDVALGDLLRKLDPHSSYIPLEDVIANEESVQGSFEGIGIEYKIFRDTLTVIRTIDDGPSERAGLKAGDRIVVADNLEMYGSEVNNKQVLNTLKGKSGTKVTLSIYRPSEKRNDILSVKRGVIPIKSVRMSFMKDDKTGYIKLSRFSKNSEEEFKASLRDLKKKGMQNLILDLRDNPGGLLAAAHEIADEFLQEEELIVYTRDRKSSETRTYASGRGLFKEGSLVILINEGSASASEIVAGAVQDNDRGWIVGRRSFGKGLVQEEMILADGSKVRLTTRKYYTPSGRSIQKPFDEYNTRYLNGNSYEDSGIIDSEEKDETYHTVGGREVFGGGGINPDVEVAIDTSKEAIIIYHLANLAGMSQRAFAYVDANRKELELYDVEAFIKNFTVDEEVMQFFYKNQAGRLEAYSDDVVDKLKTRMKSFIAYDLFGEEAYQRINFSEDPNLTKSLELIESKAELKP